jgi:hypothetical protein
VFEEAMAKGMVKEKAMVKMEVPGLQNLGQISRSLRKAILEI